MLWVLITIASVSTHNIMFLWSGYSLELPFRGDSNEYPENKFLWRTDENYPSIIIKYPPYLFHGYFLFSHTVKLRKIRTPKKLLQLS